MGSQGMPARVGGWDKVMSWGKEIRRERSARSLDMGAGREGRPQQVVFFGVEVRPG